MHTALYGAKAGFGEGPPGGTSNQANVSAIWHGDRLLTSGEVGLPYELSPVDLDTRGTFDYGGALKSAFTAQPKVDPATAFPSTRGRAATAVGSSSAARRRT